jgi:hypothetical protein
VAIGHVESWLAQPPVQILEMDATDVRATCALLRAAGAGRNLTTDAQLAALAIRHEAVIHTADSDFARFAKVRWHNPILA